jgi:hypothetical protein
VIEVLGCAGSEISRAENDVGDIVVVMYDWRGPAWSNMNAIFKNRYLVTKGWIGLGE